MISYNIFDVAFDVFQTELRLEYLIVPKTIMAEL